MRFFLALGVITLSLMGCTHTPNSPNITLETNKLPKEYALCVFHKWQKEKPSTTISETRGHYRVVVESKAAADEILDIYKTAQGSKVSMYQRMPLSSVFGGGYLESVVRDCL